MDGGEGGKPFGSLDYMEAFQLLSWSLPEAADGLSLCLVKVALAGSVDPISGDSTRMRIGV